MAEISTYRDWLKLQGGGGGASLDELSAGNADPRKLAEEAMLKRKKKDYHSSGIGSIAGGILGGAAGTLLGPLGTIGGGAAGSAAGEALEQFLARGHVDAGDVVREGALGAAGGVAGKVVGGAGKLLFRGGAKALPKAAEVGGDLLKTSTSGKLERQANEQLLKQYGTLPAQVARETNPLDTVSQLSKFGITKPEDVERVSRGFTGAEGLVTKAVRSAVGDAGKVDPSGVRRMAQDLLVANEVPLAKQKGYLAALDQRIAKLAGPKGSLNGADPSDVLEVIRHIDQKAAERVGRGGTRHLATSEDKALSNVDRMLSDELEERLYSQANPHLGKVLTPELRESLIKLHPGNSQWADYIDNTIMKSTDVGSLRSSMAPFVRGSKMIKEADLNSATFGGRVPDTLEKLTQSPSLVSGAATIAKSAMESDLANRAKASALRFASGATALPGQVAGAVVPQAAGQIGVRSLVGDGGQEDLSRLVPVDGSESQPLGDQGAVPGQLDAEAGLGGGGATGGLGIDIKGLVDQALSDPNAEGQKSKLALIGQLIDIQDSLAPKQGKAPSAAASMKMTQASAGLDALDQVEQMIGGDPNIRIKGAIPGSPGARSYESAKRQVMDMVARLQTGAALTNEEQKFYERQLPQPFDSPEDVQFKVQQLRNYFQSVAQGQSGAEDVGAM